MQFFDVNDFKIQWTVLEIKFIKGKNFNEKLEYINFKSWPKNFGKIHKNREKKLQFFGVNYFKIQ